MLEVIGAGFGRTGTYSLKLALEQLGFGPCHHMEDVLKDPERQVPLWSAAAQGKADWTSILAGFGSAVDWPAAAFWRELADAHPEARVIVTTRDAERWCDSYLETIHAFLSKADEVPPHLEPWFEMARAVTARSGVSDTTDRADLIASFQANNEAVKNALPPERLLVYEVKDGWEPLCAFLGKPVPDMAFPKTNNRQEYWELAKMVTG